MSNRFKNAVIDDVTSRNINASLQDHLLDLFESAMKSVATTLVREAKFDTSDFATAKVRGCEGFTAGEPPPRRLTRRLVRRVSAWRRTHRRHRASGIALQSSPSGTSQSVWRASPVW